MQVWWKVSFSCTFCLVAFMLISIIYEIQFWHADISLIPTNNWQLRVRVGGWLLQLSNRNVQTDIQNRMYQHTHTQLNHLRSCGCKFSLFIYHFIQRHKQLKISKAMSAQCFHDAAERKRKNNFLKKINNLTEKSFCRVIYFKSPTNWILPTALGENQTNLNLVFMMRQKSFQKFFSFHKIFFSISRFFCVYVCVCCTTISMPWGDTEHTLYYLSVVFAPSHIHYAKIKWFYMCPGHTQCWQWIVVSIRRIHLSSRKLLSPWVKWLSGKWLAK